MLRGDARKILPYIFATTDKIGAQLPKKVAAERDRHADLAAKVADLNLHNDVAGVTIAALKDGRDPFTDKQVLAELLRARLAGNPRLLDDALADDASSLIDDHGDAIIEACRKPFDAAAKALTDAYDHLGDIGLDDTRAVVTQGGDAPAHWSAATSGQEVILEVLRAYKLLSTVGLVPESDQLMLLAIADVPPAAWLDDGLGRDNPSPWQLVCAGHRLDLASPSDFQQRRNAVTGEATRRDAEARQAQEASDTRAALTSGYGYSRAPR